MACAITAIPSRQVARLLLKHVNMGFLASADAPKRSGVLNDFRCSLVLNPAYDSSFTYDTLVLAVKNDSEKVSILEGGRTPFNDAAAFSWALLLPVCSRGLPGEACLEQLQIFRESLFATTSPNEDAAFITIVIGVDCGDPVYDSQTTSQLLKDLFAPYSLHVMKFSMGYSGRICWIWERMAQYAVKDCKSDFFVLLGDDVEMRSPKWKSEIEANFMTISKKRSLPFGVACVAFQDLAFPVFPTFPVLHRRHLEIFGGRLFGLSGSALADVFVNQHGDPFLFEIYRRWGASKFSETAQLLNAVGGVQEARYKKCDTQVPWRDGPLSAAIAVVSGWLRNEYCDINFPQYTCIDIVCPTFRCDLDMLERISNLCPSEGIRASTQILFVVDNPGVSNLSSVKTLERWTENRLVRVYTNMQNLGASRSRNAGMAQSFADYVICLDDDVIPEAQLLDAYIGAVQRYPQAQALIGCTMLPKQAKTLMQHAILACGITFFYDVANRMQHPPWGVTANICFRGRTQNKIWFNDVYPKTGGGEDVDYCLRLKENMFGEDRDQLFVSVPGARAEHPFWNKILQQVSGWASGDVLCLETHPHNTFYAPPNWIETILFIILHASYQYFFEHICSLVQMQRVCLACVVVFLFEAFLVIFTLQPTKELMRESWIRRVAVNILAVLPSLLQDFVRLRSKIARLKFYQICLHFDWMDGQSQHVVKATWNEIFKSVLRGLLLYILSSQQTTTFAMILLVLMLVLWCLSCRNDFSHMPPTAEIFPLLGFDKVDTTLQPFVVLGYQRTGSNLLCGILHNHPGIIMHNELFQDKIHTYFPRESWPEGFSEEVRCTNPTEFLRLALSSAFIGKKNPDAVGFKLFPEHFSSVRRNECLLKLLQDKRVKKIVLYRENALAVQVSMLRAAMSGHYLGRVLDKILVMIDIPGFQRFLDDYKSTYEYYDKITSGAGQSVYRLSHEELITDQKNVVGSLLRFLGVRDENVPPALKQTIKQSCKALPDIVYNYDEVEFAFRHEKLHYIVKRAEASNEFAKVLY